MENPSTASNIPMRHIVNGNSETIKATPTNAKITPPTTYDAVLLFIIYFPPFFFIKTPKREVKVEIYIKIGKTYKIIILHLHKTVYNYSIKKCKNYLTAKKYICKIILVK